MQFVKTIEKIMQEKFDKLRLWFVQEVMFWKLSFRKKLQVQRVTPNDFEWYKVKGASYIFNYYLRISR